MAERKVQNKYIDPNFNHEKLVKIRKPMEKQDNVRMMLPFSIRCDTCGNYLRVGTKINMRKETVLHEDYLKIPIYRFYMKCVFCYTEMTMKTDPKNHDYTMEQGAVRLYESWKDARAAEELLQEIRKTEEEGNTMKFIEHKTYDSKKEMDALEAIDEIRLMSRGNAKLSIENMLDALNKRDYYLTDGELKDYVDKVIDVEEGRNGSKSIKTDFLTKITKSVFAKTMLVQKPVLGEIDEKKECKEKAETDNSGLNHEISGNKNEQKGVEEDYQLVDLCD